MPGLQGFLAAGPAAAGHSRQERQAGLQPDAVGVVIILDPVAVTGAPLTVNWSQKYPGSATRNPIRVANESQYQATVAVRGVDLVLQPYTADVLVPAGSATQLTAVFTALSSPLPPAPANQLVVSLAEDGENVDGTYPMALPRQAASFVTSEYVGRAPGSAGGGTTTTFVLPAGTCGLQLLPGPLGGVGPPTSWGVSGVQSGDSYASSPGVVSAVPVFVPFPIGFDTSLTVTVVGPVGSRVDVVALLAPMAVGVNLSAIANVSLQAGQDTLSGSVSIPVVPPTNYTPAPWQAALALVPLNITLNPGGVQHIIPAVANKTIYLHDIDYDYGGSGVSSGNGQFQDTAGSLIHGLVNFAGSRRTHYSGAPLFVGRGLDFDVTGASASAFLVGHVSYSQF